MIFQAKLTLNSDGAGRETKTGKGPEKILVDKKRAAKIKKVYGHFPANRDAECQVWAHRKQRGGQELRGTLEEVI